MEERPLVDGNLPPLTPPDLSPEARRKRALRLRAGLQETLDEHVGPQGKFWETRFFKVFNRVWTGAYHDGFIHAGNLAYMAILALFPFFITVGAGFSLIGEQSQREESVHAFLLGLPPVVANALEPVAQDVVAARSGWLLWAGAIVGLWTVGSLIETIRDILRRAYGTQSMHAFWRYRLSSTGVIIVAVIAMVFALLVQVAIGAAQQVIEHSLPRLGGWIGTLTTSRLVPAAIIYLSLWLLFLTLTPTAYRGKAYPKWPGALLVTVWWVAVTMALPAVLQRFFTYDLTYGSLAGVMIALFFFWLVGLGMVMGAELNAALTESPEERDAIGQKDNRQRATGAAPGRHGPQG
ncbi:YihY/virulence factor BrkB family protein [Novosphingobium sp.]|uniref:YihY/virulence factor BrkB family protein n=1 Tax=Novosphingobium sp. TaxID=1874826 RepID=UPI0025E90557|nr:YihY/virulence factor BrkB family protein [Novosphingobium sp.]